MSESLMVALTLASLAVSGLSLLVTFAAYTRLDSEAHETFSVIGADEGNHEARLERLEQKNGLTVLPSPSALEMIAEEAGDGGAAFSESFLNGQEDAEIRAEDHDALVGGTTRGN